MTNLTPRSRVTRRETYNDAPSAEDHDNLIGARITLQHQGESKEGHVANRKRNSDGTLIGTSNQHPVLDSREYEVLFPDGTYVDYSANVLL